MIPGEMWERCEGHRSGARDAGKARGTWARCFQKSGHKVEQMLVHVVQPGSRRECQDGWVFLNNDTDWMDRSCVGEGQALKDAGKV